MQGRENKENILESCVIEKPEDDEMLPRNLKQNDIRIDDSIGACVIV